jgi:hypothetical protein
MGCRTQDLKRLAGIHFVSFFPYNKRCATVDVAVFALYSITVQSIYTTHDVARTGRFRRRAPLQGVIQYYESNVRCMLSASVSALRFPEAQRDSSIVFSVTIHF